MKMNEQLQLKRVIKRTQTDRDTRESSGIINDPMDDLMMKLRRFRQLAKAERTKRKEQIQLKRETGSTRINISERSNDSNGASKIWTAELISQMKVNELLQLKRDIKRTQTVRDERESSGVISALTDNQMVKLRRTRQLAKTARMKRKEQIQLKRSRKRTRINRGERSNDNNGASKIWSFGGPTCICKHCHAIMWHAEKTKTSRGSGSSFGLCCMQGKVTLPPLKEPPSYITSLLTRDGGIEQQTTYRILDLTTPCLRSHQWEEW
jgi:hypothetical protein